MLQLGASAEYGNVQGAVFNIVTRQGGNVFHGDANFYLQTDGADRPEHDRCGRRRASRTTATRGGTRRVQASGPFIRDKFWFFGSLQYQRDWDSQPGVDPNTPAKNDTRRVFWKFNYNINAEPSADARLPRRLLLHPRRRDRVHGAEHRST